MQNHREGAVRACRCRCPSWVPLLFVMGCLNLLVTMAHAQFTLGTGRVVSVTPLDGGCISQDLPPSGTEEWRIQQNHSYLIRLEGVTECSGDTIHVHLFNPFRDENDPEDCYRPKCLPATRVGDGAYQFTVTFDQIEAKSYFIRYCTNADCSSGGVLARRSDGGNAPSTLVLTHFFPGCIPRAGHDKICLPSCCRYLSFDDLDLGCNPDRIPNCTELVDRIRCDDPSGVCCNFQVLPDCEDGADEPDPERGPCWFRRKVTYQVLTFAELEVCTVEGYIRWQVDTEPPVIEPPDGGDLGCNPVHIPTCDEVLAQTTVTDNCPHEPPTVDCRYEDRRDGCIVTRTFTITATDKCGNTSTATVVYTWNEDTEPPVIEPPDGGDLGCNPVPPECPIIIQQTTVTDNCLHEPPTVECQCEDRRDGCIVTRTCTITATDKCGNRSTATVVYTWNEDTEPPVIEPPDGGDLGCNPVPPECPIIIQQTTVTDNCLHEPPTVECQCEDRRDGCIVTRTCTITATDKCGNRSTATVVYTWNEDTEPPVIEPPDGGDLGCNPVPPECPIIIQQTTVKDNCPHEPPTVECQCEDRRDGCIVTRTCTITATDKCGNTSTATVVYTWNEDTEPPVVNNVPETDKLPCNTRPTCDLLIARHNIHAKDNCTHEPPTLHCEPGEVVDLGNCRFRQTFTFWAVDKCGNRSRDYQLVVFWKEDTEPPVLHNVPEDRDLGCNPTHIPDCDEIRSGVYATDNCDPDVPVTCTYRDIVIGCLRIRSFILAAADECGNVTTRKVVVSWTEDTTPPIVRCPDNITVQAQFPDCLVPVTWRAKAEDDCDSRPSVACNPPSGSFFGLGTTTVTCTATDRCGNSASCQFTVTVLGYICGYKFRDDNGNGVWEPHLGEPPLAGWTIELRDQLGNVLQTTTTGPDGKFCFLGLTSPGTYVVCEVLQNGWVNTTPICRTVVLPRDCGKLSFFGNRPLTQQ